MIEVCHASSSGISITYNYWNIQFFTFSGGEEYVKIGSTVLEVNSNSRIYIKAIVKSSTDLIRLVLLKDAIDRKFPLRPVCLMLPYIPYARQDRVCNDGESLSIKVLANIINSMNFMKVIVVDPHSDVAPALINNVHIVTQYQVFASLNGYSNIDPTNAVIISPDAGALKKSYSIAKSFGIKDVIRADKIRDVECGYIKETKLYASLDDLQGKNVWIFDDICDGGRTFVELAHELKLFNPNSLNLCVTHGIFSKGLSELTRLYDKVFCSTLLNNDSLLLDNSKFKVICPNSYLLF